MGPYNCADDSNWPSDWSTPKKQWCCFQHGKGCGQDAEVPASSYDFTASLKNWVKAWSEGHKSWCCAHGAKTCAKDAAAAGAGYAAGTMHGAYPQGLRLLRFWTSPTKWQLVRSTGPRGSA